MIIGVRAELLRNLFDLAVGSMDFGSGFFSTEDTHTTRTVAVLLGLDPMTGTPHNHARDYAHAYKPRRPSMETPPPCEHCDQFPEHEVHTRAPGFLGKANEEAD